MPLSQKHVDKLKMIWFNLSGELVTNEEAWNMATRVLTFFDVLLSVDPGGSVDKQGSTNDSESEIIISTEPRTPHPS